MNSQTENSYFKLRKGTQQQEASSFSYVLCFEIYCKTKSQNPLTTCSGKLEVRKITQLVAKLLRIFL